MTVNTVSFTKLTADDGYVLTNGETYSKTVCLGKNDSADNWTEIPESKVPTEEEEE